MKNQIIIFVITIATILTTVIYASNVEQLTAYVTQFRIFVNGEEQNFENPIVTINDRTYIPLREAAEVLGVDVSWFGEDQTIIMNNTQSNDGKATELFPFQVNEGTENQLWGYKDVFGTVVIEPQFSSVSEFSEGLAAVRKNREDGGRMGYINFLGEFVIPPTFIHAYPFNSGIARVSLTNITGHRSFFYIDTSGNVLFDGIEFIEPQCFSEGFAIVSNQEGIGGRPLTDEEGAHIRLAFINTNGEFMTDFELEHANPFWNGFAVVMRDGNWGLIDRNFEVVVDFSPNNQMLIDEQWRVIGLVPN